MTAASVIIAIPATLVFLLVQRHLVTGLTAAWHQGLAARPRFPPYVCHLSFPRTP